MKQSIFSRKSVYGQLILLVFLPIVLLAAVGGYLVFSEVRKSTRFEQEAFAQALLIRYEPVMRPMLLDNMAGKPKDYQTYLNNDKNIIDSTNQPTDIGKGFWGFLHAHTLSREEWLQKVMVVDKVGNVLLDSTMSKSQKLPQWEISNKKFWQLYTYEHTLYGMPIAAELGEFWLVVQMDNKPLIITYYRVALALAVTGLITLLLLLLVLNIYAKRWVAPIYEMRLYLQGLTVDNLDKSMHHLTEGEFLLLQNDLSKAIGRLKNSMDDLKNHAAETEADLRQSMDEMEMRNIEIRSNYDIVVSNSTAKSAFLANISHELRTPLNSIDGFINLLSRDEDLSDKQNLYVQTIKKSSAHLLALINDVLDFSKIEAGKLVLDNHKFDLYAAIYDVVDMLSPVASEKHLRLSVLFYHDVPMHIQSDGLRIKQILTNLVGNAIKFTDSGSVVVQVRLSDEDDAIRILVEDTGKGISQADEAQLFQSFSQGDLSVTRRYGGTGLGLVISKKLITLLGGKIGFFDNSRQNIAKQGATFWFELPTKGAILDDLPRQIPAQPINILVWINHPPAIQALKASLNHIQTKIYITIGLADLLEQLDKPNHGFNWVMVDYFGQDAAQDDIPAILRQIRQRYQGNLATYGYQVSMDNSLLTTYQTYALYEPMDSRQLLAMLANQTAPKKDDKVSFSGFRVLVVDDHLPNILVMQAFLAELNVDAVTAKNGFDAIHRTTLAITGQDEPINLIFMDIQMPKMSGFEAATQIRKIEETHNSTPIPIIALTAHGLADEKDLLMSSGLNGYISKPIAYNQLIQILQKWLNHNQLSAPIVDDLSKNCAPADFAQLPVIDWQEALQLSSYKADLAIKLLKMMICDAKKERATLQKAWQQQDKKTLSDITHKLIGGARYAGTPKLRFAAEMLEKECLDGQKSMVDLKTSYHRFIVALQELCDVNLDEYVIQTDLS